MRGDLPVTEIIGWAAAGIIFGLWLWITLGREPPEEP